MDKFLDFFHKVEIVDRFIYLFIVSTRRDLKQDT